MSDSYYLNNLNCINTRPDHTLRLLGSGLGMGEILARCPEVSQHEIDRVMRYTSEIASAQQRTIRPIPPADAYDDDEDEAPRKKRKRPRPDIK